jgi:hypothetical protein
MTVSHLHQMDVARRWRVSPRTLERWRYVGTGPRYLGGRVVYRLSDIEEYERGAVRDHPESDLR